MLQQASKLRPDPFRDERIKSTTVEDRKMHLPLNVGGAADELNWIESRIQRERQCANALAAARHPRTKASTPPSREGVSYSERDQVSWA